MAVARGVQGRGARIFQGNGPKSLNVAGSHVKRETHEAFFFFFYWSLLSPSCSSERASMIELRTTGDIIESELRNHKKQVLCEQLAAIYLNKCLFDYSVLLLFAAWRMCMFWFVRKTCASHKKH